MSNAFFDHPILNSPYDYPVRHWELDETGQPTQKIAELRRGAKFVTRSRSRKSAKPPPKQILYSTKARVFRPRNSSTTRLIVHRSEASLLLCYVGHHDKAYEWAQRRKLETHPKTGATEQEARFA